MSIRVFTLANPFYPRENLRRSYAESIIYGSGRILFSNKSISIQNHKVVFSQINQKTNNDHHDHKSRQQ